MKALLAIALLLVAVSSIELVNELTEEEMVEFEKAVAPKDWTEMAQCQWETFTIPGWWENWTGSKHMYSDIKVAKNLASYAQAVRVASNYIRREHYSYHGTTYSTRMSACTYLWYSGSATAASGHTV